ncbi:hypothetical protein LOTGIDRAFT_175748, partial [Lottia gigantea]
MATNIIKIKFTGCSTYPNITDANFDKDCNGNVVITCNEGFKMVQGLECVEEEWRYQNPICKRTVIIPDCKNGGTLVEENGKFKCNCPLNTFGDDCNCRYKYSNVKSLTPRAYAERTVSDSAKCDENCANDTKCSTSTTWLGTCLRYKTPIIFVSLDGKEDQCIEKCNEMSE